LEIFMKVADKNPIVTALGTAFRPAPSTNALLLREIQTAKEQQTPNTAAIMRAAGNVSFAEENLIRDLVTELKGRGVDTGDLEGKLEGAVQKRNETLAAAVKVNRAAIQGANQDVFLKAPIAAAGLLASAVLPNPVLAIGAAALAVNAGQNYREGFELIREGHKMVEDYGVED
jgi:hypothetical protein